MRNQRFRFAWLASAAMASGLIAGGVGAHPPDSDPDASPAAERPGLFHRLFHHTAQTLQDKMIGYPDRFVEPPLGTYVNEQLALQVSKADPHRFTLYRTDFLPGTDLFSPTGARGSTGCFPGSVPRPTR